MNESIELYGDICTLLYPGNNYSLSVPDSGEQNWGLTYPQFFYNNSQNNIGNFSNLGTGKKMTSGFNSEISFFLMQTAYSGSDYQKWGLEYNNDSSYNLKNKGINGYLGSYYDRPRAVGSGTSQTLIDMGGYYEFGNNSNIVPYNSNMQYSDCPLAFNNGDGSCCTSNLSEEWTFNLLTTDPTTAPHLQPNNNILSGACYTLSSANGSVDANYQIIYVGNGFYEFIFKDYNDFFNDESYNLKYLIRDNTTNNSVEPNLLGLTSSINEDHLFQITPNPVGSGYEIVNKNTGYCLTYYTGTTSNFSLAPYSQGSNNQIWNLQMNSDTYAILKSDGSNSCVEANYLDNSTTYYSPWINNIDQKWCLQGVAGQTGYYSFKSYKTNMYLSVNSSGTLYQSSSISNDQMLQFTTDTNGVCQITSKSGYTPSQTYNIQIIKPQYVNMDTSTYLTNFQDASKNGSDYNNYYAVGDILYRFIAKTTNKCIEVYQNDANVVSCDFEWTNDVTQNWTVEADPYDVSNAVRIKYSDNSDNGVNGSYYGNDDSDDNNSRYLTIDQNGNLKLDVYSGSDNQKWIFGADSNDIGFGTIMNKGQNEYIVLNPNAASPNLILTTTVNDYAKWQIHTPWNNYSIETQFKLANTLTYNGKEYGDAGILFKVLDANNFYELTIKNKPSIDPNLNQRQLQVWKCQDGIFSSYPDWSADDTVVDIENRTWYDIKILTNETSVQVYLGGVLKIWFNDSVFPVGRTGVAIGLGTEAYFSNFTVTQNNAQLYSITEDPIFSDNFEEYGTSSSVWSGDTSYFSPESDGNSTVLNFDSNNAGYITAGAVSWQNYKISVNLNIQYGSEGILFRTQDKSNTYMIKVSTGTSDNISLYKIENSNQSLIGSAGNANVSTNTWYRFTVSTDANSVNVSYTTSLDGSSTGNTILNQALDSRDYIYQTGAIGLCGFSGSSVSFSNLNVLRIVNPNTSQDLSLSDSSYEGALVDFANAVLNVNPDIVVIIDQEHSAVLTSVLATPDDNREMTPVNQTNLLPVEIRAITYASLKTYFCNQGCQGFFTSGLDQGVINYMNSPSYKQN